MYLPFSSALGLCLLIGLLVNVFYFLIMWRVSKAGVRVKMFATIFDTRRMFRAYRELAPSHGWRLWPIYICWIALAFLFAVGIPIGIGLRQTPHGEGRGAIRISSSFFFGWVSFVGLFFGVWFTYRVIRKLPRLDTGRRDWKRLLQDEYLRSDAYLATLAWGGLLAVWLLRESFRGLFR